MIKPTEVAGSELETLRRQLSEMNQQVIEENRVTFLATHQMTVLADLFSNGRTPSIIQHKVIKQYFKDYRLAYRSNPSLFIAEKKIFFLKNLTQIQQLQYLKQAYRELVLRSEDGDKQIYCEIFNQIVLGTSSSAQTESSILEVILNDILLKWQEINRNYPTCVKKICSLFKSFLHKRKLLAESLDVAEIQIKIKVNVPSNHKTLLPLELFKAIGSVTCTNHILSRVKGLWGVACVLGDESRRL